MRFVVHVVAFGANPIFVSVPAIIYSSSALLPPEPVSPPFWGHLFSKQFLFSWHQIDGGSFTAFCMRRHFFLETACKRISWRCQLCNTYRSMLTFYLKRYSPIRNIHWYNNFLLCPEHSDWYSRFCVPSCVPHFRFQIILKTAFIDLILECPE